MNERGIIRQYNDDGTGSRLYATGIRNAVGLTIHPKTNRLWANNNGSDNQGNEIPPEWIDLIREGGFYGFPFAYGNQVWFNFDAVPEYKAIKPITFADSSKVSSMLEPAALIRAHQAPMALQFLNETFSKNMRYGFLTAVHGSWNTTAPNAYRGYKIIYADLSNEDDTTVNYIADFCSGFLTDSINRVFWGRPVGLAIDRNGNLFMSSDEGNTFILEIYHDLNGIPETLHVIEARLYPNPLKNELNIDLELRDPTTLKISLIDLSGKEWIIYSSYEKLMSATLYHFQFNTAELQPGIYFCTIKTKESSLTRKVISLK